MVRLGLRTRSPNTRLPTVVDQTDTPIVWYRAVRKIRAASTQRSWASLSKYSGKPGQTAMKQSWTTVTIATSTSAAASRIPNPAGWPAWYCRGVMVGAASSSGSPQLKQNMDPAWLTAWQRGQVVAGWFGGGVSAARGSWEGGGLGGVGGGSGVGAGGGLSSMTESWDGGSSDRLARWVMAVAAVLKRRAV